MRSSTYSCQDIRLNALDITCNQQFSLSCSQALVPRRVFRIFLSLHCNLLQLSQHEGKLQGLKTLIHVRGVSCLAFKRNCAIFLNFVLYAHVFRHLTLACCTFVLQKRLCICPVLRKLKSHPVSYFRLSSRSLHWLYGDMEDNYETDLFFFFFFFLHLFQLTYLVWVSADRFLHVFQVIFLIVDHDSVNNVWNHLQQSLHTPFFLYNFVIMRKHFLSFFFIHSLIHLRKVEICFHLWFIFMHKFQVSGNFWILLFTIVTKLFLVVSATVFRNRHWCHKRRVLFSWCRTPNIHPCFSCANSFLGTDVNFLTLKPHKFLTGKSGHCYVTKIK